MLPLLYHLQTFRPDAAALRSAVGWGIPFAPPLAGTAFQRRPHLLDQPNGALTARFLILRSQGRNKEQVCEVPTDECGNSSLKTKSQELKLFNRLTL
jgi:hypothetical protein